jgi:hypothetical protein
VALVIGAAAQVVDRIDGMAGIRGDALAGLADRAVGSVSRR